MAQDEFLRECFVLRLQSVEVYPAGQTAGIERSRIASSRQVLLHQIYGTVLEAGANRYAAEQLQRRFLDHSESEVPIRKDFEVSEKELRAHDILFVGRPETNSALAAWRERLGLHYEGAEFHIDGVEHPSEYDSLLLAACNPMDRKRMVLVIAGNSPLETVRAALAKIERTQYTVYRNGKVAESGFLK